MVLGELLERPGLAPGNRLLVHGMASIWRGAWPELHEAVAVGRARGLPRADFEELLLQAVLFCGFPRVVTAFETLAEVWPVAEPPAGGGLPPAERGTAGRQLFAAIYGKNDAAVRGMLQRHHGELHDFVLEAAYGRILARPGLSPHVRELVAVGALAAMRQQRQFVAHARGALHFGSSLAELREVLVTVFGAEPQGTAEVEAWLQLVRR
ncbi:MAG: carboxymuconolactone decarboxylase family protein [Planctomycetes bacterium]|nr:carboxymuconolactone decarboxylase family protein [Planctomycetota bacterium]